MMVFAKLARDYWSKNLPNLTKDLKEKGIFEQEANLAAQRALRELSYLVNSGMRYEAAKEKVLQEYIFLPPETIE